MTKFRCETCNDEHDLADIAFGADAPAQWDILTDAERDQSALTSDQCVIESSEGKYYFVRACLDIPILGADLFFTWGVWVSLSERSFLEIAERWTDPSRIIAGPYFGWLCTRLPDYPDSMYLRAMLHQRPVGQRPSIELEPSDHPLARDQRFGVERLIVEQIVCRLLHQPLS